MVFRVCAIACLLSLFATIGATQPNEPRIAALVRSGNLEAAKQELARSNLKQDDLLFFGGLVAQARGDLDLALDQFDRALRANPDHLNARREIASTLFQQKRYRAAERRFQELIGRDRNTRNHALYEKFIEEIQRNRPLILTGSFSIIPSTNVNRGSNRLVFDSTIGEFTIDPEAQAQSGIGIRAGLVGVYRWPRVNDRRDILTFRINGTIFEESEFNSVVTSLGFTRQIFIDERTRFDVGTTARHNFRGDDADNTSIGVNAGMTRLLQPNLSLSTVASYEYREFEERDTSDGPFATLRFNLNYQQQPSLAYAFALGVSRRVTEAEQSAFWGADIRLSVSKEWSGGLVTGFSALGGFRNFDGLFPLLGERRSDRFVGISGTIQNRSLSIRGFSPSLTCSYTLTESNVAFFASDVAECVIGLRRRF